MQLIKLCYIIPSIHNISIKTTKGDEKFNLQSNKVLKKIDMDIDWINLEIDKAMAKAGNYNFEAVEAHNVCTESEELNKMRGEENEIF